VLFQRVGSVEECRGGRGAEHVQGRGAIIVVNGSEQCGEGGCIRGCGVEGTAGGIGEEGCRCDRPQFMRGKDCGIECSWCAMVAADDEGWRRQRLYAFATLLIQNDDMPNLVLLTRPLDGHFLSGVKDRRVSLQEMYANLVGWLPEELERQGDNCPRGKSGGIAAQYQQDCMWGCRSGFNKLPCVLERPGRSRPIAGD